jgi:hypothetical protein
MQLKWRKLQTIFGHDRLGAREETHCRKVGDHAEIRHPANDLKHHSGAKFDLAGRPGQT